MIKTSKSFFSLLLLLTIGFSASLPLRAAEGFNLLDNLGGQDDILEPDEAFQISFDSQPGQFKVSWVIAEGHYLYRDKMQITANDASVVTKPLLMPADEAKNDPVFQRY